MNQYKEWLGDMYTMPGGPPPPLDPTKMLFLDQTDYVPGWDKERVLAALGIEEVAFDDRGVPDETHGYSYEGKLAVKRNTPYPTKVLWHELGHLLCEHPERKPDRELAEAEAEGVAYLLCNLYGYNEPKFEARGYVQHWFGKPLPEDSIKRVVEAVEKIHAANISHEN